MNRGTDIDAFAGAVAVDEADIDLARCALLIAKSEYASLEIEAYLERIDDMAARVRERLFEPDELGEVIDALNDFMFREQGFSGNVRNYFDPRNSFLNEVIERRLGIPITLSLLYMEIGRRVGLPLAGVSFPGHFLVKITVEAGDIVLDPFLGGISLSREELENRLHGAQDNRPGHWPDIEQLIAPASNKEILVRMLRNLKSIYVKNGDHARALRMIQHMLCVTPNDAREIRDRGVMLQNLECYRAASSDYQRYLELAPDADDAEDVRARYIDTYRSSQRLH